jgi:cyanophycin synthetase
VTTGIQTGSQLRKAALNAAAFCPELIIEEQVDGENYRLLFLHDELLDAIHRRPPTVVGDGRRTIRELVEASNKSRLAAGYQVAQVVLAFDADMKRTLRQAGLSLSSIPADGAVVVLKTAINDNQADDNESIADRLAQPVIDSARRAAVATGVRLAGIDIITTALDRSLEDSGGVILEVNTTPGLHFHYHKRGDAARVAVPIAAASLLAAQRKRDFSEAVQHAD